MKEEKVPVRVLPEIRKKLTEHNHPEWIVQTEYIADIFNDLKGIIGPKGNIIQIGCGCGYVLDALWEVGYRNLTGVDKNPIDKDFNPQIKFIHSEIEKVIDDLPQYDVVLCHRFLHILTDDYEWLFEKIAKKSRRFLIIMEGEQESKTPFWHHLKRNYKEVFEKYGFKQIFEEVNMFPFQNWEITTVTARVFKKI